MNTPARSPWNTPRGGDNSPTFTPSRTPQTTGYRTPGPTPSTFQYGAATPADKTDRGDATGTVQGTANAWRPTLDATQRWFNSILRKRLYSVFAATCITTVVVLHLVTAGRGLLSLSAWAATLTVYLSFLPTVWAQVKTTTLTREVFPGRFAPWVSFLSNPMKIVYICFTIACVSTEVYAVLNILGVRVSFWTWRQQSVQLRAFCVLYGFYLGFFFYKREQNQLSFPTLQRDVFTQAKAYVPCAMSSALLDTLAFVLLTSLLFLVAGEWMKLSFMLTLYLGGLAASFNLLLVQALVGFTLTQAQGFLSSDNSKILDGMLSDQPLMQHLAHLDFCQVAEYCPVRRSRIIDCPKTWKTVVENLTSQLDGLSASLKRAIADPASKGKADGATHAGAPVDLSGCTPRQRTNVLFKRYQLLVWNIRGVCRLIAVSRTESTRGVIHLSGSIQRVLCSLLEALLSVQAHLQSPQFRNSKYYQRVSLYQVGRNEPFALSTVIKGGIYEIVTSFYESLGQFDFPPLYAEQLQQFMDFQH